MKQKIPYPTPPNELSLKSTLYIKDILNTTLLINKVANDYLSRADDSEVLKMISKIATKNLKQYQQILNIINNNTK